MKLKSKIKRLPSWIRYTKYCPLKRAKLSRHVDTQNLSEYFGWIFAFGECWPNLIDEALKFAEKEAHARRLFKEVFKASPLTLQEQFPDAYQTESGRNAFLQRLLYPAPNPTGFGRDNAPKAYHAAKAFKQPGPKTPKGFYPKQEF